MAWVGPFLSEGIGQILPVLPDSARLVYDRRVRIEADQESANGCPASLTRYSAGMPPLPVHRFSVEAYRQLIKAGVLNEDTPVELLDGWIVEKLPCTPLHDIVIIRFYNRSLARRLQAGWCCRFPCAVTTLDSEPEPDLAVVRGDELDFVVRHPGPDDVGMIIEVSDTSLRRDRTVKGALCARASIPVYWIINLQDGRIEVYTEPVGAGGDARYSRRRSYGISKSVPLILDGLEVARSPVSKILP